MHGNSDGLLNAIEGLGANSRTVKELKKLLPYLRSRLGTHYNDGISRDEEDNSINYTREIENSLEVKRRPKLKSRSFLFRFAKHRNRRKEKDDDEV
nr:hypothetical protein CFP56_12449 [Quercus suber]